MKTLDEEATAAALPREKSGTLEGHTRESIDSNASSAAPDNANAVDPIVTVPAEDANEIAKEGIGKPQGKIGR